MIPYPKFVYLCEKDHKIDSAFKSITMIKVFGIMFLIFRNKVVYDSRISNQTVRFEYHHKSSQLNNSELNEGLHRKARRAIRSTFTQASVKSPILKSKQIWYLHSLRD